MAKRTRITTPLDLQNLLATLDIGRCATCASATVFQCRTGLPTNVRTGASSDIWPTASQWGSTPTMALH